MYQMEGIPGMYNPFNEIIDEHETDIQLINEVLEGNTGSLEKLIYRHQTWIYNIALKMVFDPDDAEDITQEILLKIFTHLSAYNPDKAAFRTWLYRIVANHVLNMKHKKYETPMSLMSPGKAFTMSEDNIEDIRESNRPEYRVLVEEARNTCLTGLLLCLERKQRLAFILGTMFGVSSSTGSAILEISEVNFRALLSRAKKKLNNFIENKCGLVNPENPCRCEGHIRKLIAAGWIDPENPRLTREGLGKISTIAIGRARSVEGEINSVFKLFRDGPFLNGPDMVPRMKELMSRDEFRDFFQLQ